MMKLLIKLDALTQEIQNVRQDNHLPKQEIESLRTDLLNVQQVADNWSLLTAWKPDVMPAPFGKIDPKTLACHPARARPYGRSVESNVASRLQGQSSALQQYVNPFDPQPDIFTAQKASGTTKLLAYIAYEDTRCWGSFPTLQNTSPTFFSELQLRILPQETRN